MYKNRPWLRFIIEPDDDNGGGSTPSADNANQAKDDEQLGEGGKKALDAERAANKDLRAQVKALQAQAATAKAQNPISSDNSEWRTQLDTLKAELATERTAREIAEREAATAKRVQYGIDKGLPKALADLLIGLDDDKVDAKIVG